jgi:hypothetical protein
VKSSIGERRHGTTTFRILGPAWVFWLLLSACRRTAYSPSDGGALAASTPREPAPQTDAAKAAVSGTRDAWRSSMLRALLPKKGCFKASYPSTVWRDVPCAVGPQRPLEPARGPGPKIVGGGTDFVALTDGGILSAVGSFPSVSGVTSETDVGGLCNDAGVADSFTLQLNSQAFKTPACNGAANPSACLGWQQFVAWNTGSAMYVEMQYWLIGYGSSCPTAPCGATGWVSAGTSCWCSSLAGPGSSQPITNLVNMSVSASATANGLDKVLLAVDNDLSASVQDSVLSLAQAPWNEAEFNIFGAGCGSRATFNLGSTLLVSLGLTDGTSAAPVCANNTGFASSEANNLTLVPPCSAVGGASPGIAFTERYCASNAGTYCDKCGHTFACDGSCPCQGNCGKSCDNCGHTYACNGTCPCQASCGNSCDHCGHTLACDGTCPCQGSCGSSCDSCGHAFACDGTCPCQGNCGQSCDSCGHTFDCNGTCPSAPSYGSSCDSCGHTYDCNGNCQCNPSCGTFCDPDTYGPKCARYACDGTTCNPVQCKEGYECQDGDCVPIPPPCCGGGPNRCCSGDCPNCSQCRKWSCPPGTPGFVKNYWETPFVKKYWGSDGGTL